MCAVCAEAQIRPLQNYVVVTFEQVVNKSTSDYYWIIPIDSLNSITTLPTKIPMYPLYVDDSSDANFHRCIEGETIYYMDNYSNSSESYEKFTKNALDIIRKNRKLVETIKIAWENRSDEQLYVEEMKEKKRKITVYITPLSGVFANCPICEDVFLGGEPFANVFFPVSDVSYFPDFWKLNHSELLFKTNFIYLDYSSYIPSTAKNHRGDKIKICGK